MIALTFAILFLAMVLFISGRLPNDLSALIVAVLLGVTGVLSPQESLSGFSHSAVITIIAVGILAEGLERTGVTKLLGQAIQAVGGGSERRLIVVVMLASAGLSLFMNNLAAASILLPSVSDAGRRSNVSMSRLGMPLAFGTLLGGMATLFTTTNIVVSALLRDHGLAPFGIFDFFPIGIPLLIIGTIFMALRGPALLPGASAIESARERRRENVDLVKVYGLGDSFFQVKVGEHSPLAGSRLGESLLWGDPDIRVIAVENGDPDSQLPDPEAIIGPAAILVLQADPAVLIKRYRDLDLVLLPGHGWEASDFELEDTIVTEVLLAPRSRLIGKTIAEVRFKDKYGITVLAIWGGEGKVDVGLSGRLLTFGDALLVQGEPDRLRILATDPDLIVLGGDAPVTSTISRKSTLAVTIMVAVVMWAALDSSRSAEILLAGALVMVVAKVLTMDDVYRAVEWRTVFTVAGILPMALAITKSGAGVVLADLVFSLLGSAGPYVVVTAVLILAVTLTQLISGLAVAAILAPIAISAAIQMGINPRMLAMVVALSSSMAFVTPLGHAVNLLVVGPSGYQFRDFARVGLPLTVILSLVILALVPLVFGL